VLVDVDVDVDVNVDVKGYVNGDSTGFDGQL